MTPEQLTRIVQQLETENLQLRRIHDDQRDHLAALRAEIRELQHDLSKAMADYQALKTESPRLVTRDARRLNLGLPIAAAVGLTMAGAWLFPIRRSGKSVGSAPRYH